MTSIKCYLCEDPSLRSHCEVLGARTVTCEFGEGHNSTHKHIGQLLTVALGNRMGWGGTEVFYVMETGTILICVVGERGEGI